MAPPPVESRRKIRGYHPGSTSSIIVTPAACPLREHCAPDFPGSKMPPKAPPKPFDVDGVECTVDKSGLVNVGLNAGWDRGERFPTKVTPGSDIETMRTKVRQHHKFARLAARAAAQQSEAEKMDIEPSATAASQPLQRELQSLGLLVQPSEPPSDCGVKPLGPGSSQAVSSDPAASRPAPQSTAKPIAPSPAAGPSSSQPTVSRLSTQV